MMRPAAIPTPAAARPLVDEILAIQTGFWTRLRELNDNDREVRTCACGDSIDVPSRPTFDGTSDAVDEWILRHADHGRHERSTRGPHTTGADIDALLGRDDHKKALEAKLRKKYFPRAARVSVDRWGVYTWSPTGRVVRKVWTV